MFYRKVSMKTIVYVLNKKSKPLMPTSRCGHVRKLLKEKKAVPVCNNPFTIRLKYETPDIVQDLYLGIDTGRENIGIAVSKESGDCVYLAELETKNKSIKKRWKNANCSVLREEDIRESGNREKQLRMGQQFKKGLMIFYAPSMNAKAERLFILEWRKA